MEREEGSRKGITILNDISPRVPPETSFWQFQQDLLQKDAVAVSSKADIIFNNKSDRNITKKNKLTDL